MQSSTPFQTPSEGLLPCPLCKSVQIQVCRNFNNPKLDSCRCRNCKCTALLINWQNRSTQYEPQGLAAFKTAMKVASTRAEHPDAYVCGYILLHPVDASVTVIDRSMLRHFTASKFFEVMHK